MHLFVETYKQRHKNDQLGALNTVKAAYAI